MYAGVNLGKFMMQNTKNQNYTLVWPTSTVKLTRHTTTCLVVYSACYSVN